MCENIRVPPGGSSPKRKMDINKAYTCLKISLSCGCLKIKYEGFPAYDWLPVI